MLINPADADAGGELGGELVADLGGEDDVH
jgi:hypothetical protein